MGDCQGYFPVVGLFLLSFLAVVALRLSPGLFGVPAGPTLLGSLLVPPAVPSDPYVLRSEPEFCAPFRDYTLLPTNSILRFLHKGTPPYFVSVPLPDHVGLAAGAVRLGGLVDSGYDVFQRYVEGTAEDAIMLDIGGHYGFAGLPVAATGRTVISFEPVPRNQRILQLGVCFNGFFDGRYTLVRGAVGAVEGNTTLYVPTTDWTDNAALTQSVSTLHVGGASEAVSVRIFTLDAFAAAHLAEEDVARIEFIKVDVQGHETGVFRGGRGLLARLRPGTWVVAEHMTDLMKASGYQTHDDVEAILPLGYSVHGEKDGPEVSSEQWDTFGDLWYKKTVE